MFDKEIIDTLKEQAAVYDAYVAILKNQIGIQENMIKTQQELLEAKDAQFAEEMQRLQQCIRFVCP